MTTEFTILPDDVAYRSSPDAGDPDCICSRCSSAITSGEVPMRSWTTNAKGKVDRHSFEYRYCEACMSSAGITVLRSVSEDDDFFNDPFADSESEFTGELAKCSACLCMVPVAYIEQGDTRCYLCIPENEQNKP